MESCQNPARSCQHLNFDLNWTQAVIKGKTLLGVVNKLFVFNIKLIQSKTWFWAEWAQKSKFLYNTRSWHQSHHCLLNLSDFTPQFVSANLLHWPTYLGYVEKKSPYQASVVRDCKFAESWYWIQFVPLFWIHLRPRGCVMHVRKWDSKTLEGLLSKWILLVLWIITMLFVLKFDYICIGTCANI